MKPNKLLLYVAFVDSKVHNRYSCCKKATTKKDCTLSDGS